MYLDFFSILRLLIYVISLVFDGFFIFLGVDKFFSLSLFNFNIKSYFKVLLIVSILFIVNAIWGYLISFMKLGICGGPQIRRDSLKGLIYYSIKFVLSFFSMLLVFFLNEVNNIIFLVILGIFSILVIFIIGFFVIEFVKCIVKKIHFL